VLIDAKRGDTPQTMRAYARAIFDELGADAVTLNPYMGGDALAPFFDYPDRGVFVLCKTSNPGSGELQDLEVNGRPFFDYPDRGVFVLCKTSNPGSGELQDLEVNGRPLFVHVARRAVSWDKHGTLGLVVGATYPSDVASVRDVAPDAPILLPGVGAQAGDLERSVQAAVDKHAGGALVNASRSVLYAGHGADWQTAARAEAQRMRSAINAARGSGATATR
jgi:orotidine-5'-phosphate decarboxylase